MWPTRSCLGCLGLTGWGLGVPGTKIVCFFVCGCLLHSVVVSLKNKGFGGQNMTISSNIELHLVAVGCEDIS